MGAIDEALGREWLAATWKLDVVRGVSGMVFGVVAMIWPVETALALAVLWGVWAVVDGLVGIVLASRPQPGWHRVLTALLGLVALGAGVFAIVRPGVAAITLVWLLGIWLVARGIYEVIDAFGVGGGAARALLVAAGLVSVAIGVLFIARPGGSAVALAFWVGALALAWGVVLTFIGLRTRRELRAQPTLDPVP